MRLDGGPAKGLHETGHLQAALGGRQVSGGQELHPGQSAQPLKGFLGQGQDGHVFSGGDPVAAHDSRLRANHLRLSCSAWRYAVRLSWSHNLAVQQSRLADAKAPGLRCAAGGCVLGSDPIVDLRPPSSWVADRPVHTPRPAPLAAVRAVGPPLPAKPPGWQRLQVCPFSDLGNRSPGCFHFQPRLAGMDPAHRSPQLVADGDPGIGREGRSPLWVILQHRSPQRNTSFLYQIRIGHLADHLPTQAGVDQAFVGTDQFFQALGTSRLGAAKIHPPTDS